MGLALGIGFITGTGFVGEMIFGDELGEIRWPFHNTHYEV